MGGGAQKKVRAEAGEEVLRRGAAPERGAPGRFWSRRSRRGWPGDGGMGRPGVRNSDGAKKEAGGEAIGEGPRLREGDGEKATSREGWKLWRREGRRMEGPQRMEGK